MIELNVEFDSKELDRLLAKISDGRRFVGDLVREAANVVEAITIDSLANEKAPDGSAWAPLKPETIAYKQRRGKSNKTLEGWGDMRRSIRVDFDGEIATLALHAVSGGGYPYPTSHQFGAPKANIPARPFLPISKSGDDLTDDAKDRIRDAITTIARRILG